MEVTGELLREWPLPAPGEGADKHDRGTVLVVGGTATTPGAALLAGTAALRAGAGRLQVATAESCAAALAVAVPEAMVVGLPVSSSGSFTAAAAREATELARSADAVVLGPGLSGGEDLSGFVSTVLGSLDSDAAVVIDAGALGALAGLSAGECPLPNRSVLTPNAGELAALLEVAHAEESEGTARSVARRFGTVTVVRGWVADAERSWHNPAGNPGLATSGSGDVLAGLVGGLLARSASAAQAGVWGQHLHVAAGDRLATRVGRLSYLARELIAEVPAVFRELEAEDGST